MNTMVKWALNMGKQKIFWPLLALAILLIFNFFQTPGFFDIEIKNGHLFGSIIDILFRASPLIIISIGMTLVIALEGIDISVGSVLAITGASAIFLVNSYPIWIAIPVALGVGLLCGLWNGMLVAYLNIQPMVATLILLTVGRGIAQLITNGRILIVSDKSYEFLGKGYLFGFPFAIYIALFVLLLVYLLKTKTAFGLFLESTGANKKASEYAGIKPRTILMIAYGIAGLCAGIAGIILSSNMASADANNAGLWWELDAILAVVIGGTSMRGGRFYLGGTLVGALFIQTLTTSIYAIGVPAERILLVKALVVIIVSLMQSDSFRQLFKVRAKKVMVE
ncbi:ABC transporter permease [Paenibacillus sp. FA6]|uniref:ABC transporter permease n=1 Tax=Paenibacillus sp. FA6 TaxID=3413029 RepID=UPI003F6572EE